MSDYTEQIDYPPTFAEFVCRYSFVDDQEVYTNGATLVPTFRVTDAFEHYNGYEHERHERLAQVAREMYSTIGDALEVLSTVRVPRQNNKTSFNLRTLKCAGRYVSFHDELEALGVKLDGD